MWVHTHFEATVNLALFTPVCYSKFSHVATFTWWVPCWSNTRINIFKIISSMVLHTSTKEWSTPITTQGAKVRVVAFIFCGFNTKANLASFPWINLHSFLFRFWGWIKLQVWSDEGMNQRGVSLFLESILQGGTKKSNGKTFMFYRLITNLKNSNESIRQN